MSRTIIHLNQSWLFAKERDLPIFNMFEQEEAGGILAQTC